MTKQRDLEFYRDLFCEGKLNLLVSTLEKQVLDESPFDMHANIILLRSTAYYELGRINEAIDCLKLFLLNKKRSKDNESAFLFTHGRLAYVLGDINKAEQCFEEMLPIVENKEFLFKALIGLGNIHYTKASWGDANIEEVIPTLQDLERNLPTTRAEFVINLEIFKGNVERVWQRKSVDEVNEHFLNALAIASESRWQYYICHSIYGLANTFEHYKQYDKMQCNLSILKSMVHANEMTSFSQTVNKKFEKYGKQISLPVQFDVSAHRIRFEDEWVHLHEKPLLYMFLEKIYSPDSFISKKEVASVLWPDQTYSSHKHDARIFDVARRAKALIKQHAESVVILSSRSGYRLVNKSEIND